MNLTVNNLSNDLAKNNAVYISSQLAKDPSKTVNVRINSRIIKCCFLAQVEKNKISMSKNVRNFLNTDVGKNVTVEPVNNQYDVDYDLSFLELEVDQVLPRLAQKTKIEASNIVEALRNKEKGFFFNLGETKYVEVEKVLYSVKANKCLNMMTGDNKKISGNFGKLLSETQIQLKTAPNGMLDISAQGNEKSIFRPDFSIEDMGIGGLDEQLFNIFRRTFASRRYSNDTIKRFGIKHVKGILLFGPPGTGKTLIARQLAKALNVKDLKIVNGPEIFSKFVGESEENIRKLFAEARADENKLGDKSPLHIIVFDEIDAICKQRGMHGGGVGAQVSDQVVNQLLTNIDGVEALNNIVVIGMTNRKDLLDEAILRPGRFEVHIEVKLPNTEGREQILRIHTKKLRENKLLHPNCKIDQLARLTKNFTGAEIEALVKCAASHSISRTTNILEFSKELMINEAKLGVQMQDFLKALEEVRPQFGVDQQKFGSYFREKVINYGPSFDRITNKLQQTSVLNEQSSTSKRNILLYGKPGTGKTTAAINFVKKQSFSYLKIVSPENLVGQVESQKIRNINKVFEDAYKTTNACIVIDCIERLIDYSPIGRRFSNNILQTLLLLIEKSPPKEENKLLIIGTTSAYYNMQQLDITPCFDIKIEVGNLHHDEIQSMLKEKYRVDDGVAKKVANMLEGCCIKELLDLAQLVDKKSDYSEWQYFWSNLLSPKEEEELPDN